MQNIDHSLRELPLYSYKRRVSSRCAIELVSYYYRSHTVPPLLFHRAGLISMLSSKYFRMRFVFSLVLFGSLFLQVLAAPAHNAQAGPSTAGGTSSGSTVPSHPGGSPSPVQQPVAVEYGKVYGATVKDYRTGPQDEKRWVPEHISGNHQARKRHANAINVIHPFIPTHKEGNYHVGFSVTHSPPKLPGTQMQEHHVPASNYGNFKDDIQKIKGKTVHRQSQILTTPRYVAEGDLLTKKPPTAPDRLDVGKFEELKKHCTCSYVIHIYCCLTTCCPGCKREIGGYVGRTVTMNP